jgi:tetratricopeptide (TPR) repeat protein
MKLLQAGQFKEAIPYFEKSYNYFSKHKLLDKFRMIIMLSIAKLSYKERAALNLAYSYSQVDEGLKAQQILETILQENPNNHHARANLNMLTTKDKPELKEDKNEEASM